MNILFACLYRMLPHLSIFLHFFLACLLPYLSFSLRIDPLRFYAGCRKRRLNLALVFFMFILCCAVFFFDWRMCAFVVLCLVFFHTKPVAWGNVSEMTCLCRVGRTVVFIRKSNVKKIIRRMNALPSPLRKSLIYLVYCYKS